MRVVMAVKQIRVYADHFTRKSEVSEFYAAMSAVHSKLCIYLEK